MRLFMFSRVKYVVLLFRHFVCWVWTTVTSQQNASPSCIVWKPQEDRDDATEKSRSPFFTSKEHQQTMYVLVSVSYVKFVKLINIRSYDWTSLQYEIIYNIKKLWLVNGKLLLTIIQIIYLLKVCNEISRNNPLDRIS